MKVAIIGSEGVLGRAQRELFAGHVKVNYDIAHDKSYPYKAIAACDFAVVCVGTPPQAGGRNAYLGDLLGALHNLPHALPVLVRSTVPPGTMERIAGDLEGLVAHSPEFIYEREGGAWSKSADVPYVILGGEQEALEFFDPKLAMVYGSIPHLCDLVTAEMAKYVINLYWATKVTFVNQMAILSQQFGADWEAVRQAWTCDPRVNEHYTYMGEEFPPGFGGRCWPKDIAALIEHARSNGHEASFLQAVETANLLYGGEVVHDGARVRGAGGPAAGSSHQRQTGEPVAAD